MNKLAHIDKLLGEIKLKNDDETANIEMDKVDKCIMSYVDYHNEAVSQGALIATAKFRLDDEKFGEYIEKLHNKRKNMHETMIDKTIILNEMCEQYNIGKIYEGKLDTSLGRSDNDTRFGVAGFAEELCKDFFKTTHEISVTEKAKQAYIDYAKKMNPKASMFEKMMAMSQAKADMDSSGFEKSMF